MSDTSQPARATRARSSARPRSAPRRSPVPPPRGRPVGLRARLAGGTDGNEQLTILAGALLFVLFAVLGITILRIGQLLWLHLFLGLALLGPVALKLASTGYRFTLYYLGDRSYRRKGPPPTMLRMLAPVLVASTLAVFATGVALLLLGPQSRQPLGLLHKASFILWLAVCAVHVLAHLPEVLRAGSGARATRRETLALSGATPRPGEVRITSLPGAGLRAAALVGSVAAGLLLALALTGLFHRWTG